MDDWRAQSHTHSGSNYNSTNPVWNHLWKLKIPPKHANLIWRILNQALPVKGNLAKRGIKCDLLCTRCNQAIETMDHVFIECEWAKAIWFGSPLAINFNHLPNPLTLSDWISELLLHTDSNDICKIIGLIYHIWYARNLLIFQNKDIPVMMLVSQAMNSVQEFQATATSTGSASSPPTAATHSNNNYWTPPPKNALKLNVDAHPCGDGRWGLGLLLGTERGKCVGAMTKVVSGSDHVLDGEAYGLNAALDIMEALPDTQIIVEMDSSTIVSAVKKKRYPRCYWGKIASRCGKLISQNPRFSIEWVCRSGNSVAHTLANWARLEPNKFWNDTMSNCIHDMIQKDISTCNFAFD